ncbi:hypothetical protein PoB_002045900 [Plakobranchus ocellatus]|uniref:Uncharacterized protein n=1 Tax=Plakobranchus ocellatus TaxID=259542 RepID=A0AAV3ZJ88_9GAST|nr:hypothetical protein PoB_002045900 [Plakobranchus ocellatus]
MDKYLLIVYNKMTSGFKALRQGLEPVTEGSLQISGRTHKPLFTDASGIEVHVNHELTTQEFKDRVIRTKKHRNGEQATENSEVRLGTRKNRYLKNMASKSQS